MFLPFCLQYWRQTQRGAQRHLMAPEEGQEETLDALAAAKGDGKRKKKIMPFKLELKKAGKLREGSVCSEWRKGVRPVWNLGHI